ncbi:hypothetical protein Tco_1164718 [Tanacetum coccineum]
MEEGVLEQWVLGWILLSVLHVERGKWKDGRERVSLAFATSTCALRTRALHLAIETTLFRCAGFRFLFRADILSLLIQSGPKRCYNRFSPLPLHTLFAWNFMSLPTPVSWLGSHTESVIAAMSGMRKAVEELSVLTDKYKKMKKQLADSGTG